MFNGRTINIPLERVLRWGALIASGFIALISGAALRAKLDGLCAVLAPWADGRQW